MGRAGATWNDREFVNQLHFNGSQLKNHKFKHCFRDSLNPNIISVVTEGKDLRPINYTHFQFCYLIFGAESTNYKRYLTKIAGKH